jgi:hypothetical protein
MVDFLEIPKDKMLTVGDMVEELKKQGFPDTKAVDRKDVDGKHYVEFIVRKGKRTVGRRLYEYNIGSLSMIQKNRRYFLEEIVETFRKHEEEEHEALPLPNLKRLAKALDIPVKVIDYDDIRDLYPETMYVSDIIQNIINQKEKEKEMSNCIDRVKWKVGSVTFDRRTCSDEAETLAVELKARPIGGYTFGFPGPHEIEVITGELEKRLNGNTDDYKRLVDSIYGHRPSAKLPAIEKVIFNAPATIVFWKDGSDKTIVKTQNGEAYDPEKGLAMAITKKALGNEGKYFNEIKKWVGDYEPASESKKYAEIGELVSDGLFAATVENLRNLNERLTGAQKEKEACTAKWMAYQRLQNALNDKKATKSDLIAAMKEAVGYLGEGLDT